MLNTNKKVGEKIRTALFDLTHLEINTIIKEDMDGSKSPDSARLLLDRLAKRYSVELIKLGKKYNQYLDSPKKEYTNIFRGFEEGDERPKGMEFYFGSGYKSFRELSKLSKSAVEMINSGRSKIPFSEDEIEADMRMLQRMETISDDIRSILKVKGVDTSKENGFDFDDREKIKEFRLFNSAEAKQYELDLDLRQYMVIKKASDIGTERILLQTIIGMDGDVTTRISKEIADNPISFINEMHHDAIQISVKFWDTLVSIIVEFGKSIFDLAIKK